MKKITAAPSHTSGNIFENSFPPENSQKTLNIPPRSQIENVAVFPFPIGTVFSIKFTPKIDKETHQCCLVRIFFGSFDTT